MAAKGDARIYELDGIEVKLSSPDKVYFPEHGTRPPVTKGQLADFYVGAADAVLNHLRERPTVLKRYAGGIESEPFYQKRVPAKRPGWLETVVLKFPSGREAEELVPVNAATLVWGVSLGNVDWNPHPVRRADLEHPDELRVDLDPMPDAPWDRVRRVALIARDVLEEHGLVGFPKTSGSRGMHIPVRIETEWDFVTVRRAALALAREIERRSDGMATTKFPARLASIGDPSAGIDDTAGSLASLLAQADQDEADRGLGDAPWPPHFAKQQPEREGPHRRQRLFGPAGRRRTRLDPAALGRGR
jgi:bifunctional non-homologous end joining protein LigD